MIYGSWDDPLKTPKKHPWDIISLHKCTINDNNVMHSSWDMKRNRQKLWSFWAIFCSFTLLTTQKIKILKKWKKYLKISLFYTSVSKIMIICYTVPEIWCVRDVIVILCPFTPPHHHHQTPLSPPNRPKNPNVKKMKRTHFTFYTRLPKTIIKWCTVLEIWCTTERKGEALGRVFLLTL